MVEYKQVKKLNELEGHKEVYVITAMHPTTVSAINLVGVAKEARQHVGNDLKRWIKNKELYIKDVSETKTRDQQLPVQPHSNRKRGNKGGNNAGIWDR